MFNWIKKLFAWFNTKSTAAMTKTISAEEQYRAALVTIIDKIKEYREISINAEKKAKELRASASDKRLRVEAIDKEIRAKKAKGFDTTSLARLAVLNVKTIKFLEAKAQELEDSKPKICAAVVALDQKREDLKIQLEIAEELKKAQSLGIETAVNIEFDSQLVNVNIDDTVMRVETFTPTGADVGVSQSEIDEYLENIK